VAVILKLLVLDPDVVDVVNGTDAEIGGARLNMRNEVIHMRSGTVGGEAKLARRRKNYERLSHQYWL
jgi:hypothetical protein